MVLSRINRGVFTILKAPCKRFCSTLQASIPIEIEQDLSEKSFKNQPTKAIPLNIEEFKNLRRSKPCQPKNPHLLRVAILGEPNVGKSTLTNHLVKWKVCAVSKKVHTTRKKAAAVLVEQNKQIVFLDTPGFVTPEMTKRHHLEPSFVMDPVNSLMGADLIAVVVDITNKWTNNRINEEVLEVLDNYKEKKSILIMNKIDAMKSKSRILSLTRTLTGGIVGGVENSSLTHSISSKQMSFEEIYQLATKVPENTEDANTDRNLNKKGWPLFSRVFMVSALKGDGMDDLREYLLSETIPHEWMYHESTVTDQHPYEIAVTILREKLLEYLPDEIPYQLDLRISKWELLSTGCPKINMKIVCANSRHARFVIGPAGKHIAACVENTRKALREAFRKDVVLKIGVDTIKKNI